MVLTKFPAKTHKVMIPKEIDVREIRGSLNMSRTKFSNEFGFNPRTVEKWEQGERHPDNTAKHSPKAVQAALKK